MNLKIEDRAIPYHEHNITKEEEPKCCFCDSGLEVKRHTIMPIFSKNEMSYMILCEKDHKKLIRRIKYKWFYNILNVIKGFILWVKINMKKVQ